MAKVTLADVRLPEFSLDGLPRLAKLRRQGQEADVCIERARHITTYLRDLAGPQEPSSLRYAKAVRCFLSNKAPRFFDGNLLAGTTTSKRLGAAVYPESLKPAPGPEEWWARPQRISPDESEELGLRILPFWRGRGLADAMGYGQTSAFRVESDLVLGLDPQAGYTVHEVPSLRLALERGLSWMVQGAAEQEQALKRAGRDEDSEAVAAQRAIQETLTGLIAYSANLGRFAALLAQDEADPGRRRELEHLAAVCAQVPAGPARTFREAVNGLWLLLIGLQAENQAPLCTPGRLDQLLYPWYRRDVDRGVLRVGEALELVGCLWLKFSDHELIRPTASGERNGGAALRAEVTLGGVDAGGEDAVNDLTYVMLRATELLQLEVPRLNVRCHRQENSQAFRQRVAEVCANPGAVSVLLDDQATIQGLEDQGFEPGQARDYALILGPERAPQGWREPASHPAEAKEPTVFAQVAEGWTELAGMAHAGLGRSFGRCWAALRQVAWGLG